MRIYVVLNNHKILLKNFFELFLLIYFSIRALEEYSCNKIIITMKKYNVINVVVKLKEINLTAIIF